MTDSEAWVAIGSSPMGDGSRTLASAEHDVLAYMAVYKSLRSKLHGNNPLQRVNKEIKRRTDVVGFGGKTAPHAVF